jgi:hypothetical protein
MKPLLKGMIIAMSLSLIGSQAQAEIVSLKTMKDLKTKVEDILKTQKPKDVLVAFDIDMTLTQPDHPAVYYPALIKYKEAYKKVLSSLTPEQKDLVSTLTTQEVPQKLVDPKTPGIIKALQEQGIKAIALTASLSGKIKGFKNKMAIIRRDQLQKMGIDFTQSFKDFCKVVTFSEFKLYAGGYPLFYHGILSTNGEKGASKGDTLVAFLKHIGLYYERKTLKPGYSPRIIVFVDDKKKHLENVETALKTYDPSIQFIGIEYKGAYEYAPQEISQAAFEQFWQDFAVQVKKHAQ